MTPPCIALHGWCFGPGVWQPLAALRPSLQALALPGYDGAPAPALPRLDALAQAVAQRLPASGPVDLLGWSLGALVALQLAATQPQRVRRLVLLGATARFLAAPDHPGVAEATLAAFGDELVRDPAALQARFALLCAQGEAPASARALVRQLRSQASAPAPVLADGLAVLASADLRAQLPTIGQPTLLLHGAHDALMPAAAAQAAAQALPQGRCQTVAGAGHALPLSAPPVCAQALEAFLA